MTAQVGSVILEASGIAKYFDGLKALTDVNLKVFRGECLAIIGPNGAGKTTFFNILTGLLRPTAGRILFEGADITDYAPHRRAALGISRTMQITSVFPRLSVLDNVLIGIQGQHAPWKILRLGSMPMDEMRRRAAEIVELVGLGEKADVICANLAHGDQRLVEIALALSVEAKLLLLDEPTAGLSLNETRHITGRLREIWERKKLTIVIVEHDMEVALGLATRVAVFHQGTCLAIGEPDVIMADEVVNRVYLKGHARAEA
jgi:branched-chain amino acid transport system ATP-binding protein